MHVANSIAASIGVDYKPTNQLIAKAALSQFEANFATKSQDVTLAHIAEQNATDAQIAAFKLAPKRVTRIMKAVRAQGLGEEFIDHLQSNVYRMSGVRIGKSTPDTDDSGSAAPPTPGASVSRRSYAEILEQLREIVMKLKTNPAYDPNEPEYKSEPIEAWVSDLGDLHNAALEAKVATRAARNARNIYAYNEETGIIPRMNALKNYLGYILDKDDPRLKQLRSLKFVDNTR